MTEMAITLRGISKRYGSAEALRNVNLEVPTGSFFALLGPNGAGKTTLLRTLAGLIRPDSGTGAVLGEPLGHGYPTVGLKARIGYVSQQQSFYERMTVQELIDLCRGLRPRWSQRVVTRYLDLFGLSPSVMVRRMSTGMRAQLGLTLVMGGEPELLILDEPTLGLDPLLRHQYLQALVADTMETGRTVLLSSHDLDQIERLSDQVAILRSGAVTLCGAVDDLKMVEKRVRVAGTPSQTALERVEGVWRLRTEGAGWLLFARGEAGALRQSLLQVEGVTGVQVLDQSLEEIFFSYVSA